MLPKLLKYCIKDVEFGDIEGRIMYINCLFDKGWLFAKWVPRTYEAVMHLDDYIHTIYHEGAPAGICTEVHLRSLWNLHKARRA